MGTGLSTSVGQRVTIRGMAGNAFLGAVVLTPEGEPIYIDGLQEWDDALNRATVAVTGRLEMERIAPAPVVGPDGGHSQGMEDPAWVLHDATWQVA